MMLRMIEAWVISALLVFAATGSLAGQGQDGDAWVTLGPAQIGASFDEISTQIALTCSGEGAHKVCAAARGTTVFFGKLPVARIEALFDNVRLVKVTVSLSEQHYDNLLRFLIDHYSQGEDRSFLARAGMAGEFVAGLHVWRQDGVSLVFEQYAGKIDRCALSYGSEKAMADLVRKATSYPRGARRDL